MNEYWNKHATTKPRGAIDISKSSSSIPNHSLKKIANKIHPHIARKNSKRLTFQLYEKRTFRKYIYQKTTISKKEVVF